MSKDSVQRMMDAFAMVFLLSQRFEYIANRSLKRDGLTTKQFLAIAAIEKGFDSPPSISEVGEFLSTSHQNVKQIADQLERKGFIKIEKDSDDRRRLLLKVTKKNKEYWESKAEEHIAEVRRLFDSLTQREIDVFYNIVAKLLNETSEVYRNIRLS
ncbi:MAG: MarR family winged helix-turn-helix transcriptional regulator [Candidatus Thorarchaeota archaeon]